jgi:CheY-like chemotaxis protein
MRVLIADDNEATIISLCALLEDLGHEAVVAGGATATHMPRRRFACAISGRALSAVLVISTKRAE